MKGKKQSAGTNPWTGCAFVSQMPAGPATQCRTREPYTGDCRVHQNQLEKH